MDSPRRSGKASLSHRHLTGLYALSVGIVAAGTLVAWLSQAANDQASAWVTHTQEVLARLSQTYSLIQDAESGQRGYLLTGDRAYLEHYERALAQANTDLNTLGQLIADNPVQQRNIATLRQLSAQKFAALHHAAELFDRGERDAALAVIRSEEGLVLMRDIRVEIDRMREEEQRLLAERRTRAAALRAWGVAGVLSLGALALALLIYFRRTSARDRAAIFSREQRLKTIFTSIGDAVISTDRQGRTERMNPIAEELTGWPQQEALGQPLETVFRIIHQQTRAPAQNPVERVLREGKSVALANHTALIARDGREYVIEDSAAPIRTEAGGLEGIVLVFHDATEKYVARMTREKAEQALAESEALFRTLADNIPALCWMADPSGSIFWYNSRWYEYTGTTPEAMQGWGWQSVHDPDVLPTVLERWRAALASGAPFEMIFPLRDATGVLHPFLTRVAPVRDAHGQIVRWFGTNTDISDLQAAQHALREANRRKDEFLATLAHELRNPIAPIHNAVHVLAAKGNDEKTRDWAVTLIDRQIQSMALLLDELLDVSRITSGTLTLRRQRVSLASVLDNAIEVARPLITARRHRLTVNGPAQTLELEVDPLRLSQIVTNLLTNAAKYTDCGGTIEMSISETEETVIISGASSE